MWAESAETLQLFTHPEVHTRESALRERLKKINLLFVETEDFQPALDSLNTTHVVVLSGEPGVGKTTLAEYLCQVHMKDGYRIDVVEGDITQHPVDLSDPDRKVLLYFDDFLGANYFAAVTGNQDSAIVRLLDQIRNEPNKRLILTSRANIISKAEILSQPFRNFNLTKRQYVIRINRYSKLTKAKILYNHLWHSSLASEKKLEIIKDEYFRKVIEHRNFNPRLIAFGLTIEGQRGDSLAKSLAEHLERPDQIWDHCYTVQLDEQARILVKLCVASGGKVSEDTLVKGYDSSLSEYNFVPTNNQPTDFEYTSRLVCNSLLVRNLSADKVTYSQFNPSVSDYVIPRIANFSEARRLIRSLDSTGVVSFFSDLATTKRMKRSEVLSLSNFLLERYLNVTDDRFAISLDLALYLEDETPQLKIAIDRFCDLDFSESEEISGYRLVSILEKAFQFGVSEATYIDVLRHRSFGHRRLNEINLAISDLPDFKSLKVLIKEQVVESLAEELDEIISESDGLNECENESDVEAFAEGCIEALAGDYPMLDDGDISRLVEEYSIDSLLDTARDRWNSHDDEVESETRSWEDFDKVSEDEIITEMFQNFGT